MSPPAPRRRRRWILLALGAVVAVLGAGVGYVLLHEPGNVSNPDVEFRAEPTTTPLAEETPRKRNERGELVDDFTWPTYGFTPDRRRALDVPRSLRPPFRRIWTFNGRVLLEFPPVMEGNTLYILKDNGRINALDKRTGDVRWAKEVGTLAASSPAIRDGRLYLTVLERREGAGGRVLAMNARTGRVLWSRSLPSRTESSPVVSGGAVYFGSENGTVYALRESDGGVRWTFKAAGAVKGALALNDGKLYFGDYAGRMYAVRASSGRQAWSAKTQGARFGFASGRFYATPAVAYGRVYIGNVDGYVYSFSERDGELAWRTKTAGYVYSSPAVGSAPGDKPTVYVGSYDGTFYAMDARSGSIRWRFGGGSKISGAATLLGDIVYFADLGHRRTIGLGARTGRKVFEYPRGGYNPVITDGQTLFLVGYGAMYAFRPLTAEAKRKAAKRKAAKARAVRDQRRAAARRDARRVDGCRARAARLHRADGPRIRSFRRCVDRRRAAATRRACTRRARAAHDGRAARRRSVRRCVARNR